MPTLPPSTTPLLVMAMLLLPTSLRWFIWRTARAVGVTLPVLCYQSRCRLFG